MDLLVIEDDPVIGKSLRQGLLDAGHSCAWVRDGARGLEAARGTGVKAPVPVELGNIPIARKRIVAARAITKGERITASHLAVKRPGNGRSPFDLWDVAGTDAARDYAADDPIE